MQSVRDTNDESATNVVVSPVREILVAEDDLLYGVMLQRCLSEKDYVVQVVRDGVEALQAARSPGGPRLLVLDWMMPRMCGLEVCRKLRDEEDKAYRYMLLLTSKNKMDDLVEGLEAGADDYLTKPFDVQELLARINVGRRLLELHDRLAATEEKLRYQATHDELTGIWNRRALVSLLAKEADRAHRVGSDFCLFMLDLDHFKKVNDSYGHMTGDMVLREVAARLSSSVRSYDVLGRYGGEEFIIVGAALGAEGLAPYAERLREIVASAPVETSAGPIPVTVSIGVASSDGRDFDFEAMLRKADEALYVAKRSGRNRFALG